MPRWLTGRTAAFVAILALGASLRFLYIDAPIADQHRWRQLDTAAIARNMYRHSFNPLYPQVDWGGAEGYVETEFPLVPAMAALGYFVFGLHETLGRLISIAFSLGAIALLYHLGRVMMGPAAGRAAAFLLAVSPSAVFYGRAFMPDAAMVCLSIGAVLGVLSYFQTGHRRWLVWGTLALTLAGLAKLPAVMMFGVVAVMALEARGWAAWRDKRLVGAMVVSLAVIVAWYVHAWGVYEQTGITFGLIGHPAGTYPRDVAPGPWTPFSKWSSVSMLTSREFYAEMFERLYFLHLLPWGFAGAIAGMLMWRPAVGRWMTWAWLGLVVLFILVAGEGNVVHDYYQLPIVPVGALFFAALTAPLFDAGWIRTHIRRGWAGIAIVTTAVTAFALVTFYYSGVVRTHFRPEGLDYRMLSAGSAIDAIAPDEALAIVIDDYGLTSPVLLYFANLRGWSFDAARISSPVIAWLHQRGAQLFVTTAWSAIQSDAPEAAGYLERFEQVPLEGAPRNTVVFDLSKLRLTN